MKKPKPVPGGVPPAITPAKPSIIQPIPLTPDTQTRGASIQGERQNAKGGPAGANQGGASRGSSRLEPSHQKHRITAPKRPEG